MGTGRRALNTVLLCVVVALVTVLVTLKVVQSLARQLLGTIARFPLPLAAKWTLDWIWQRTAPVVHIQPPPSAGDVVEIYHVARPVFWDTPPYLSPSTGEVFRRVAEGLRMYHDALVLRFVRDGEITRLLRVELWAHMLPSIWLKIEDGKVQPELSHLNVTDYETSERDFETWQSVERVGVVTPERAQALVALAHRLADNAPFALFRVDAPSGRTLLYDRTCNNFTLSLLREFSLDQAPSKRLLMTFPFPFPVQSVAEVAWDDPGALAFYREIGSDVERDMQNSFRRLYGALKGGMFLVGYADKARQRAGLYKLKLLLG